VPTGSAEKVVLPLLGAAACWPASTAGATAGVDSFVAKVLFTVSSAEVLLIGLNPGPGLLTAASPAGDGVVDTLLATGAASGPAAGAVGCPACCLCLETGVSLKGLG
jgi:hypothetical protein